MLQDYTKHSTFQLSLRTAHASQANFTGEAKGAREATKQLGAQLKALDSEVLGSEGKIDSLLESFRKLEKRQKEQHSAAAEAKSARGEAEQLREQVHALRAAVSGSESKMATLLQAVRTLETRQQNQHSTGGEAEQLREQVHALRAAVSGSERKTATLLQAVRTLETRQQNIPNPNPKPLGTEQAEEQVSRQQIQASEEVVIHS